MNWRAPSPFNVVLIKEFVIRHGFNLPYFDDIPDFTEDCLDGLSDETVSDILYLSEKHLRDRVGADFYMRKRGWAKQVWVSMDDERRIQPSGR